MTVSAHERRLGDDLVKAGRLTPEALASALAKREDQAGVPFRKVLVQQGFLAEPDLLAWFAERYRMQQVNLPTCTVAPESVALVPYSMCTEHVMMPLSLEGDVLTCAIADPLCYVPVEQDLQTETGKTIHLVLAAEADIRQAQQDHYAGENGGDSIELKFDVTAAGDGETSPEEIEELERAAASVAGILNNVLAQALQRRASDVHFEPAEQFLRVRLRVDGVLQDVLSLPSQLLQPLVTRVKVAARLDIGERRFPQDGNVAMKGFGRDIDLRVNTLPTIYGERVVMRILDKANVPGDIGSLGLEPDVSAQFQEILAAPHGVVLVTGPTGSGKTTTLYGALRHLCKPGVNVLTVEDPVEYKLPGISQVQTHGKIGFDFAKALRAFLRQDPDVILLGEIRDEETAHVAMHASMTGHLVLSTLHMNSAAEAVTRLMEMGVKQYVVGSTLRGVMAQRLVRKICTHCKAVDGSHPDLVERLGLDPEQTFQGTGCDRCGYTGNHGRTAINELLVVDDGIRERILGKATAREVHQLARRQGMRTLADAALLKVRNGISGLEEVMPYLADLQEPVSG